MGYDREAYDAEMYESNWIPENMREVLHPLGWIPRTDPNKDIDWASVRKIPELTRLEDMTIDELRGGLCESSGGDLENCKKCKIPCMIGKMLMMYERGALKPPESTEGRERLSFRKTMGYIEAEKSRKRREAVVAGLEQIQNGADPEEIAHELGYKSYSHMDEALYRLRIKKR